MIFEEQHNEAFINSLKYVLKDVSFEELSYFCLNKN